METILDLILSSNVRNYTLSYLISVSISDSNVSIMNMHDSSTNDTQRLRGLAVACWTTDHYHRCSNLGVGISEGCFTGDFASLHLKVARPIYPTVCTKVAAKHQSSSSTNDTLGDKGLKGNPLYMFRCF